MNDRLRYFLMLALLSLGPSLAHAAQLVAQPRQAPPPGQLDPMQVILMQQAAMENNAVADAEFDPPVVTVGERTIYRVVVTAMSEGVSLPAKIPAPEGLELKEGGHGMSFAPLGQVTQSRTTFNFHVTASAPGVYTIPAFVASANGKSVTVPERRLTVVPAGTPIGIQSPRLVAQVPDGEFYIGQAIPVQVALLDHGNNSVQGMQHPQALGDAFLFEQSLSRQRREFRNDRGVTLPALVDEVTVIPIKEGRHTLSVQAFIYVNRPPSTNRMIALPLYNPLLESERLTVTVHHVPDTGRLPGFTGLIGTFQVEPPRLSTNQVRAGEPISVMVTVKGAGNLTRLVPPPLERVADWQVFPPVPDLASPLLIQQRGSSIFSYTMIPLTDKIKETPPIPFSYFDPYRKTYVDLTVPSAPVRVLPAPRPTVAANKTNAIAASPADDFDHPATARLSVMTGIVDQPGSSMASLAPVQERPWFLLLQLVPAAVIGGLLLWDRRRRYLEQHPEVILKKRARRGVKRQLRLARRAAAAQDPVGFVTASVNALREACAPHRAANPEALVCADVLEELPAPARAGSEGGLVRKLFGAADSLRFVNRMPNGTSLVALEPEVEHLLTGLKRRL